MRHWIVFVTAALASTSPFVSAQSMTADDDLVAVEALETIELPAAALERPGVNLSWDCDVLLLSTSQRYRPSSCKQDASAQGSLKELPVERVSLEPAEAAHRKTRN